MVKIIIKYMKQNNILLTGFKKASENDISTSKILLDQVTNNYDKFLFTNDFNTIEKEAKELLNNKYDYIIMLGQKPKIKDIVIEISAHNKEDYLYTNFPLDYILKPLKDNKINYNLRETIGDYYCNYAYYQVLKQVKEQNMNTKVIFIHIPYLNNFKEINKVIKILNKERK